MVGNNSACYLDGFHDSGVGGSKPKTAEAEQKDAELRKKILESKMNRILNSIIKTTPDPTNEAISSKEIMNNQIDMETFQLPNPLNILQKDMQEGEKLQEIEAKNGYIVQHNIDSTGGKLDFHA